MGFCNECKLSVDEAEAQQRLNEVLREYKNKICILDRILYVLMMMSAGFGIGVILSGIFK